MIELYLTLKHVDSRRKNKNPNENYWVCLMLFSLLNTNVDKHMLKKTVQRVSKSPNSYNVIRLQEIHLIPLQRTLIFSFFCCFQNGVILEFIPMNVFILPSGILYQRCTVFFSSYAQSFNVLKRK